MGLCHCGCGNAAPIAKKTAARYGHVKGQPVRYIRGHSPRTAAIQARRDLPPKGFDDAYVVDPETGCWEWQLRKQNGYGYMARKGRAYKAARYIYEQLRGPIPEGMQLDHLCRNRPCVNPDHLEPVTPRENTRRGAATKLNVEAVRDILTSSDPHKVLAARYGVCRGYIANLRAGCAGAWTDVAPVDGAGRRL